MVGILFASIFLLFIFRISLLTAYASFFQVDNAIRGADAIICLAGGRQTRIPKTIELWKKGFAPKAFLTSKKQRNQKYNHLEISDLHFAKEVSSLMKFDGKWEIIPNKEGGVTSTFDEASDVLAFAKKNDWKRVIIVTDNFHTRRALYAFEKVFKESGIVVQSSGVGNDIFNYENWWKSDQGIMAYLSETIKFPVYLLWSTEPKLIENH